MPSEKDDLLEFNQYMKSDKMPYIIYSEIESLIRKRNGCAYNPENSSSTKIGQHIPRRYLISTIWGFDLIKNKHAVYRGKYCMKNFFTSLSQHTKNINDFEKKKMLPLTKEEVKSHQDVKVCYICEKRFLKRFAKDKSYQKVIDHCHYTSKYRGAVHSICNLKFIVLNEIHLIFHNGSNYDYQFIIEELVNESVEQFEFLGENTEKFKTFSLPIEKEVTKIDKRSK